MARNRERRKANERRRAEAALPPEEQERRHQKRLADYQARYRRPPVYRTHLGDDSLRDTPKPESPRVSKGSSNRPHFPLFDFFLAMRMLAGRGR